MIAGPDERSAELRLEAIGGNLIEVSAFGAFGADDVDAISRRLTRLTSGGPARVRIDCSRMTALHPDIIGLFSTAATDVARGGGELQLVALPERLGVTDANMSAARQLPSDGAAGRTRL